MKTLGIWTVAALLAVASGTAGAQDRAMRDGVRDGAGSERHWRDGHRDRWRGDPHPGRHWSRPHHSHRYGGRDWGPRYYAGTPYDYDGGYPGWLHAPFAAPPVGYFAPPVYIERFVEREPVYIERFVEREPVFIERFIVREPAYIERQH